MAINDETSAVHRVFNITELLERILLEVTWGDHKCDEYIDDDCDDKCDECDQQEEGLKTVLLSQRVNKTFEATINGSTKILRALWLLPPLNGDQAQGSDGYNPLLVNRRSAFLDFDPATPKVAKLVLEDLEGLLGRSKYFQPFIFDELEQPSASLKRMHFIAPAKVRRAIRIRIRDEEDKRTIWGERQYRKFKIRLDKTTSLSIVETVKKVDEDVKSQREAVRRDNLFPDSGSGFGERHFMYPWF